MSRVRIVFGNQMLVCDSSEKDLIDRFLKMKETADTERATNVDLVKGLAETALTSLFGGVNPGSVSTSDEHLDS